MIPLTGITLPFISYGGSSMVTSFALLGLILSVSIKNERLVKATDGYEYLDENQDSEQEGFEDEENREQELDDGGEMKSLYRDGRIR